MSEFDPIELIRSDGRLFSVAPCDMEGDRQYYDLAGALHQCDELHDRGEFDEACRLFDEWLGMGGET